MHVQSNRTRTRVHLYCTHSISGSYTVRLFLTEPTEASDGAGPVQHQGPGPGARRETCTCGSGEGLKEGE